LVGARKVRRRSQDGHRDRSIDRDLLGELWTLGVATGPDRTLWTMAYETCARADELLDIGLGDLDLGRREGRAHGKGGNVGTIWWATGTPGCPGSSPAHCSSPPRPTRPTPAADVDPASGRARLS
jgi:integrase/recombinase XerC/integrase/recombinase XerD